MLKKLEEHLKLHKQHLAGTWVKKNSSYEKDICDILSMQTDKCRYWDATWNQQYLEFKKGNNIWIDLVRYSEIFLKTNDDTLKETWTLFFIPNDTKDKIEKIVCIDTKKLIKYFKINKVSAKSILSLEEKAPRTLNVQANLMKSDLFKIANFAV